MAWKGSVSGDDRFIPLQQQPPPPRPYQAQQFPSHPKANKIVKPEPVRKRKEKKNMKYKD
jgi:hypothetical protein